MAASATPPNADLACVAVATSGGRDSTALLHATARAARAQGLRVVALHVHHGLLSVADAWVEHLQRQCLEWNAQGLPVELRWCRLQGRPARGESVEAWARKGRYRALTRMAHEAGAGLVLLAHHRRDQAETFLLQALRGGGAAGLASMPRQVLRDGLWWVRPWLQQSREAIEAYVQAHGLAFVEDPSNEDHGFARNRLRHQVMPALSAAFPDAEASLAAATRQAQQARECLSALADMDLGRVAQGDQLCLAELAKLSPARQMNLLRHWLWQCCGRGPSEALLQRLVLELPGEPPASWQAGEHVLHRYRGLLRCEPAGQGAMAVQQAPPPAVSVSLSSPGRYRIPGWSGWLELRPVPQGGIAAHRLQGCEARARLGGEQFQAKPAGIPRSLKKQYQAEGVPAWRRGGPLLWLGEDLLFVPGLGIDARQWAPSGELQWALEWVPDAAG
jgi:tRNA(Ile)-lysidine synthase